jgi:uncharacterized protein YndB with AHSA1/START domain
MTHAMSAGPFVLRLERTFRAHAGAVFEAWTSAEVLRRWWPAGPNWETPVAEVDVRVGGRLRLVMRSPDGAEFGGGGAFVEIVPPRRLVFTWTWDGHERHEGSQLVEVDFHERDDGTTTVVLTNRGLRDEESRHSHREGWEASFDNLERVLAA